MYHFLSFLSNLLLLFIFVWKFLVKFTLVIYLCIFLKLFFNQLEIIEYYERALILNFPKCIELRSATLYVAKIIFF